MMALKENPLRRVGLLISESNNGGFTLGLSRSAIRGEHGVDLSPARNALRDAIIPEFMTEFFQPRIGTLPFQVIERFFEWHIIPQCGQLPIEISLVTSL